MIPFLTNPADIQNKLLGMDKCFKDGQIPCRWVADLGYGAPIFNYSAPLPYYFGELIFFLTKNLSFSIALMFAFSTIGSLASLYFIYKYWGKFNIKSLLFFSLGVVFLMTSYNRSVVIFLPAILILITFSFFKSRQVKFLWFYMSGLLLGLALSSFYILPRVFEKNLVHQGYLPIYAREQPSKFTLDRYQILTGESLISRFNEGSNWISFSTDTKTHTIIRLSQYYFPEWRIFVDGKEIKVEYKNNSLGLMTMMLGKGNHAIYAKFFDTPIRILANLATLAGFLITLLLFVISFARVRQWLTYYKKRIN